MRQSSGNDLWLDWRVGDELGINDGDAIGRQWK